MTEEVFLHRSGAYYRTVLENVMPANLVTDLNLTILGASKEAGRLYGYPPSDLVGRNARVLFSSKAASQIHRLGRAVLGKKPLGVEGEVVRSDGDWIPVWITADLVDTAAAEQILLSTYDIARLKLADDPLRTPFQLDLVQDALIVRDLEDKIRFWNQGAARLYGWRAEEVLGRNVYDLLFPGQLHGFHEQERVLANTGEWTGEMHQVTRARRNIVVESCWKLQRDESGRPQSVLIVNRDITEKKMLEREILRVERMENIGRLATAIAHDLNNVLPAMLMSIRGLRQELGFEGQQALESSQFQAERAAQVIAQLLSLTGDSGEESTLVDLGRLITETEKILKSGFPKSIKIETAIAQDLWTVVGNTTQLYQVLLNLCLNARDSMPSGGTLTIEAGNLVLDAGGAESLPEAKPGEYVVLKVTDTGAGIPVELTGKIFEPFFTTKERKKGTGLGLFSVARIVKNHGGFISLSSACKQGAQFVICLPAEKTCSSTR